MLDMVIGYAGIMALLGLLVVIVVRLILMRSSGEGGASTGKVVRTTALVAFAVAFLFQVSTPKLLEELTEDRAAESDVQRFKVAHITKMGEAGVLVIDQEKIGRVGEHAVVARQSTGKVSKVADTETHARRVHGDVEVNKGVVVCFKPLFKLQTKMSCRVLLRPTDQVHRLYDLTSC